MKGLIPHLVDGGLTHLQYADDTVIMIDRDNESIRNIKFILYCFEMMSGLQINYEKREVIVIGTSKQDQLEVAKMLNCKEGSFPMNYLGIPISNSTIRAADLIHVNNKIRNILGA